MDTRKEKEKPKRGPNFKPNEDVIVVRAYNVPSEDPTMSTNRGDDTYWKLVEKRYNTLLTENMDDDDVVEIRSFGALKSRYKKALQKIVPCMLGFTKQSRMPAKVEIQSKTNSLMPRNSLESK
jgi:hypothetical protein